MNITDIRIRKIYEDARLKALVSVTIDGDLAVHDIKVIEGPERLFVARSPVFLRRPALWQQREGIRRIFDTPSTSSSARGTQTGRYWRFDHVIL